MADSAVLQATFVTSNKQQQILVDDKGLQYRKKRTVVVVVVVVVVVDDTGYWICRQNKLKNCSAKATTTIDVDGATFIKQLKGNHSHSTEILKNRVAEIENSLKHIVFDVYIIIIINVKHVINEVLALLKISSFDTLDLLTH